MSDSASERAIQYIAARSTGAPLPRHSRIVLHFHPEVALAGILRDGEYRSQFETGTSNGGLSAQPGGDRWDWERRLFGGAYDESDPHERPKYGALLFDGDVYGAAPRFGSAYLILHKGVLDRSTFCYPDSTFGPTEFGTSQRMSLLDSLVDAPLADPLDRYVEAHVHSRLTFDDIEALVLDPAHANLAEVQDAPFPVRFHPGFSVDPEAIDPDYRGHEYVALAHRLAGGDVLTPSSIAAARGSVDEQDLKRVWHCLARFGRVDDAARAGESA